MLWKSSRNTKLQYRIVCAPQLNINLLVRNLRAQQRYESSPDQLRTSVHSIHQGEYDCVLLQIVAERRAFQPFSGQDK